MKALYDHSNIEDLLPQRFPMVQVDSFYGIHDQIAYTSLTIRPENIFVEDGFFTEEGLTEHMAQSAAARAGYLAVSNQRPIRLGYIGAVSKAQFSRRPIIGEKLMTEVRIIEEVMQIALIEVVSRIEDQIVASCRMKIFTEA